MADRLAKAEEELARLRFTLDVMGTVDFATGLLNRNGVLEALERGRRWMNRRGDIYGVLVVRFPSMRALDPENETDIEILKHLGATIAAGVRDVDEVGRLDELTYASVLADLKPGAIAAVISRVEGQVSSAIETLRDAGGAYRVAGVEILNSGHTSGVVLESAERLIDRCQDNSSAISQV